MKDKLKAIFDSKTLWTTLGFLAGSTLGAKAGAIVAALGELVMTAI